MSRYRSVALFVATVAVLGSASALVWNVPEDQQRIQWMIDDPRVQYGDTISVWGPLPGHLTPPWTYYENVHCWDKNLSIVNRSFLPGRTPGYDSSWEHVIIDGRSLGPVVDMHVSTGVLKGFTIQNGLTDYMGGGVHCSLAGSIIKNHIHHNVALYSAYGGAGKSTNLDSAVTVHIHDNLIEDNYSPHGPGGGICAVKIAGNPNLDIQRNVIRRNEALGLGGGVYLEIWDPSEYPDHALFLDNVVVDNCATGDPPRTPYGGGIFVVTGHGGYPITARRNVIMENDPDGVATTQGGSDLTDFGTPWDPGLNVIMNNVTYDLSSGYEVDAVGNYWGYLDTPTILERIRWPIDAVRYDPVAASSRWFDVDLEPGSHCETDVLVTGDLRVTDSLTVDAGKKFEFWLDPDTSLEYGDPDRTDLLVEGSSAALTSVGTAENTILYTSRTNVGEWMPGDWYGIRVRSGAQALLRWSEIRAAYSGVEVTPVAYAEVESSKVHGCLFAGVNNLEGQVQVHGSQLTDNGIYGVRCEFPGLAGPPPPSRVDSNQFSDNGHAAVSFTCVAPVSHAQHEVIHNQVVSGNAIPAPAIHGIEIELASDSFRVEGNHVSGFYQAGIALEASSASIAHDTVVSNSVNGIACSDGSHPEVRWNTVNSNQLSGIACVEGSDPHVRRNSVNSNFNGVYCDPYSFPDLGTVDDPGNNSILLDNVKWVNQVAITAESVMARLNWWGTPRPDLLPGKFVGNIAYRPWLSAPPPDEDGQQSAGSASSRLETALGRPLPMPMRGTARIPFQVAQAGPVSLNIVDASGRVVRALVRGERAPGRYNVTWDRSDNSGRLMPEGVYFLRFEAGARRDVQKLVVMR